MANITCISIGFRRMHQVMKHILSPLPTYFDGILIFSHGYISILAHVLQNRHTLDNSIPLSIFPVQAADKFCFCFCGLPGRGKTHISRRLAKYLTFFHSVPVEVFNAAELGDNDTVKSMMQSSLTPTTKRPTKSVTNATK